MILAKRFTAKEALSLKIIDAMCAENEVLPKALELANSLASKGRKLQ